MTKLILQDCDLEDFEIFRIREVWRILTKIILEEDCDLEDISSKHGVATRPRHLLTLVLHTTVLEPNLNIFERSIMKS